MSEYKEGLVIVLDIGPNANEVINGKTFFARCKQYLQKLIQRKIFSGAKDQLSFVQIGSTDSYSECNYHNIQVCQPWLTSACFNMLRGLENLSTTSVDTAEWLDGLVVAVSLMGCESELKQFKTKKIIVLSNFGTEVRSSYVEYVIEALREMKINLVVIGLNDEEEVNSGSEHFSWKSMIQRESEIMINRIVDEAEGIKCSFDEATSQLYHFKTEIGKVRPWSCDLDIGGGDTLLIPINGFKKVASKTEMKWMKRKKDTKSPVARKKVYFLGDDEVCRLDVIKCYKFGQSVVPVSDGDRNAMTLTTTKSLKVIGFTKKENVPQYRTVGDSVHYIVPKRDVKSAEVALAALVKALMQLDLVAIVRKVHCKNSTPRIGALLPVCEQESYFFYLVQLPFSEDEQYLKLPSLWNLQPTQSQVDIVDQLIDDMDLSQFEEDEDPYTKLVDPCVEHQQNVIVFKALHTLKETPLNPSDAIKELIHPRQDVLLNALNATENIKKLFQLEELEQETYRRSADVLESNRTEDIEVTNGKPPWTEIGLINPESDFLKLLELGEPFNELCEQMQTAIATLTLTSSNTMELQTPFSALVLLRKHCVEQNPDSYNEFISDLKNVLVEKEHKAFWNEIVQDKLGLITLAENGESGVDEEIAEIFYMLSPFECNVVNYGLEALDVWNMIMNENGGEQEST